MKHLLTSLLAFIAILSPIHADFDPFGGNSNGPKKTEVSAISEVSAVAPGDTFTVAVKLKHIDGWHSYYKNPGGPGIPLEFSWNLPDGFELKTLHWPTPHLYTSMGTLFYMYEGEYSMLADITVPKTAKVGEKVNISVTPSWQLCDKVGCDPPESKELTLSLPIAEKTQIAAEQTSFFAKARSQIPKKNDAWDVKAEVTTENFILTLTPKEGNTQKLEKKHFVLDTAGSINAEKPQTITEKDGVYTITIPREASVAIPQTITGLLIDETKASPALAMSVPVSGDGAGNAPTQSAHGHLSTAPTPEMIAEAAKLYHPEEKIDYVKLDGTEEKPLTFLSALFFIFIGGLLLNLMPCVFPVLGIKVMGFAQQAGSDPKKIKMHGLVFMSGLVVSMWILAGIIYTLKGTFGVDPNWGEQLTNPVFLAVMIILLFVFGLNMAGLFEFCTSLTGVGGELQTRKGYTGSFFSGVLTTLIATPCSGPFLGSVMAYALNLNAVEGMILFTLFALGISVPYVVLAFLPNLINKLPRPGAWMVTFKQLMSFALFATAAYFYQSFAKITGITGASDLIMALVLISLAIWAYGRFGSPFTPKLKRFLWGFGFPVVVTCLAISMTRSASSERAPTPPLSGSSWYPGVVEQNRAKKRIVWVDYTADW